MANLLVSVPDTTFDLPAEVREAAKAHLSAKELTAGAVPAPLFSVKTPAAGSTTDPLDVIDGVLYGAAGTTLRRSTDEGKTWTDVTTTPYPTKRLLATADGQVLAASDGYIHKSNGWGAGTVTWTLKVDANGTAGFYRFSVDGDGTKFIASEYSAVNRADSRFVHISTDAGATWATVWDTATLYPDTQGESHVHGCCYDPWEDRFWFTEGHGTPRGFYWSDDDGVTWTKLAGPLTDMAATPTVLVATDDGIACGTDDHPNGILGIRRTADPADLAVTIAYQWQQPKAGGAYGFAERGFRDPRTGIVYFGFRSEYASTATGILAGTATAGAVVWQNPTIANGDKIDDLVVTPSGRLIASLWLGGGATKHRLTARTSAAGAPRTDTGNLLGGFAVNGTSTAIGPTSSASGNYATAIGLESKASSSFATAIGFQSDAGSAGSGVAIGYQASSSGTEAAALGRQAVASGIRSTAIGMTALASGSDATAIGRSAQATATNATALGQGATAVGEATAVGKGATASALKSTAIGEGAVANKQWSTAIGEGANAGHDGSVALGSTVVTTATNQVALGNKHLELTNLATHPGPGAANTVRLYVNGNKLYAQFATNPGVVIATAPA